MPRFFGGRQESCGRKERPFLFRACRKQKRGCVRRGSQSRVAVAGGCGPGFRFFADWSRDCMVRSVAKAVRLRFRMDRKVVPVSVRAVKDECVVRSCGRRILHVWKHISDSEPKGSLRSSERTPIRYAPRIPVPIIASEPGLRGCIAWRTKHSDRADGIAGSAYPAYLRSRNGIRLPSFAAALRFLP